MQTDRDFRDGIARLIEGGDIPGALAALTDFAWLMERFRALEDPEPLQRTLADWAAVPRGSITPEASRWMTFFSSMSALLGRGSRLWPAYKILVQLAVEHGDDSPVTAAAERWLAGSACDWRWLRRRSRPAIAAGLVGAALVGRNTPCALDAVRLSGSLVLSCYRGLTLWDVPGRRVVAEFGEDAGYQRRLFRLSEAVVASAGECNEINLWSLAERRLELTCRGHEGDVRGLWQLAGDALASWSSDRTLRVWDRPTGACLRVIRAAASRLAGAIMLPGSRVATWGEFEDSVLLWDLESGATLHTLKEDEDISGCWLLSDGSLLTRTWKGISRWDPWSGRRIDQGGTYHGCMPLADGRLLAWTRKRADILRVDGLRPVAHLPGATNTWGAVAVDRERVVVWDREVSRVYSLRPQPSLERVADVRACEAHVVDGLVASCSWPGGWRVWDPSSGAVRATWTTPSHSPPLRMGDGTLVIRDGPLRCLEPDAPSGRPRFVAGHDCAVKGALLVSPSRLVTWGDATPLSWALPDDASPDPFRGHDGPVLGALRLDEDRLLTWSEDATLRVWSLSTRQCLRVLSGHGSPVREAFVLPSGRVVSRADDSLRLWDPATGAEVTRMRRGVSGMRVREDGLLAVWDERDVGLLDLETPGRNRVVGQHAGIEDLAFAPDDRLVAICRDRSLRTWSIAERHDVQVLESRASFPPLWPVVLERVAPSAPVTPCSAWALPPPGLRLSRLEPFVLADDETHWPGRLLFLDDGRLVTWAGLEHAVRIWEPGPRGYRLQHVLRCDRGYANQAWELPAGRLLVDHERAWTIWDTSDGSLVDAFEDCSIWAHHPDALEAVFAERVRSHGGDAARQVAIRGDLLLQGGGCSVQLRLGDGQILPWFHHEILLRQHVGEDGEAVLTTGDGQVACLRVWDGGRRA